jgi:hypothetical protein
MSWLLLILKVELFSFPHFVSMEDRDSEVGRLTTGWTIRETNPGGGEIFHTRPERPWGPPSVQYNGHRDFPGAERPGRGVDHPPHLAQRLKKE